MTNTRTTAWETALLAACLLVPSFAAAASPSGAGPIEAALAAHRAWWQAYTQGDREMVAAHTADDAVIIFSNGVALARAALLEETAKHSGSTGFTMDWSGESVRTTGEGLAVVTATSTEGAGSSVQTFRLTTVLDRAGGKDWRVVLAQSTRVARFATPVPLAVSGRLEDFVGS